MWYALLHVLHLLAAIAFIGVVFFQLVILARVRTQLEPAALPALNLALSARTRAVLHWVVLLLYGVGRAWPGDTGKRWVRRFPAVSPPC